MKILMTLFIFGSLFGCKVRTDSTLSSPAAVGDPRLPIPKCKYPDLGEESNSIRHRETLMLWGSWKLDTTTSQRLGGQSEANWKSPDTKHIFQRNDTLMNQFSWASSGINKYKVCYYSAGTYTNVINGKLSKLQPILIINFYGNSAMLRIDNPENPQEFELEYLSGVFGNPAAKNDVLFLGGDNLKYDYYSAFKRVSP